MGTIHFVCKILAIGIRGVGLGAATPPPPPRFFFSSGGHFRAQRTSNIRTKSLEFWVSTGKIFGQETSAPAPNESGHIRLRCLLSCALVNNHVHPESWLLNHEKQEFKKTHLIDKIVSVLGSLTDISWVLDHDGESPLGLFVVCSERYPQWHRLELDVAGHDRSRPPLPLRASIAGIRTNTDLEFIVTVFGDEVFVVDDHGAAVDSLDEPQTVLSVVVVRWIVRRVYLDLRAIGECVVYSTSNGWSQRR